MNGAAPLRGASDGASTLPSLLDALARRADIDGRDLEQAGSCGNGGLLAARVRLSGAHTLALQDAYRINVLFYTGAAKITYATPMRAASRVDDTGHVSVLPPAACARWHCARGEAEYLLVCFPAPYAAAGRPLQLRPRCLWTDAAMLSMGRALREVVVHGGKLSLEESCAWATLIGNHVVRHCADRPADATCSEHARRSAAKVNHVIRHIDEHLHEALPVAGLARLAGMSRSKFSRAFRSATGLPPHQYLVARRIDRAKGLLAGTDRSLADIALAAGFSSQSHMTTCFRHSIGQTPSEFRDACEQAERIDAPAPGAAGAPARVSDTGAAEQAAPLPAPALGADVA